MTVEPEARQRPGTGGTFPGFPRFQGRAPWLGADLQTLRNAVRGVPAAHRAPDEGRRVLLPLRDRTGDTLAARLNIAGEAQPLEPRPLVVLIHGLAGSEDSAYMVMSACYWLARGHNVLRLNLRGAGPSREHCRLQYHAGRSEDLRQALESIEPTLLVSGLVLIGFSLGGNMLLKFLAEYGAEFSIRTAASVSAPIDLAAASQRFLAPRNWFYHRHLLQTMKAECSGGAAEISDDELRRVQASRSIYEFDDCFVAPRNGFRDAPHYYAENRAQRFLDDIRVPTLMIQALDDPWIPTSAYTDRDWSQNPCVVPLLSPSGGHVGFHDRASRTPWYDRCIGIFFDATIGGGRG